MHAVTGRRGLALIELVVVILLLGVVAAAIHDGLRRQQRVFGSIASIVATRTDVRDAAEVLAADLVTATPRDTLPLTTDSAVEFFSTIGASVSCDSAPGYTVRIPPEMLASALPLTSLLAIPDSGDLLLIFSDDTAAAGGPRWDRHTIASVTTQTASVACPASSGLTADADGQARALVITLGSPARNGVRRGAPIRIVRRTRYSLYRSGSGWYLGTRRCNAVGPSVCGIIQPLSGPYLRYTSSGGSGVGFRYFGAVGPPLSAFDAPLGVARVEVVIRGAARAAVQLGVTRPVGYTDSARVVIALRNRD